MTGSVLPGLQKGGTGLVLVLALLSVVVPSAQAQNSPAASFQEIEESLTCQCGCGLTVHSCNHVDCGSALPLRKEIREQMALGKSKEEILRYFEAKYGEKILSSPTTRGFNLLAWIAPFFAVAVGGVFLVWTLRRWMRVGNRTAADLSPDQSRSPDLAEDERLRQELERFEV
ncbi:Cytochrome c-type biogenesis protein CcmH [bacterium HR30]|nr:Cytochrome c-type biogenesis protein CcmH [bacterium HR30]